MTSTTQDIQFTVKHFILDLKKKKDSKPLTVVALTRKISFFKILIDIGLLNLKHVRSPQCPRGL